MNNRFKELVIEVNDQAIDVFSGEADGMVMTAPDLMQFAELVVKDCLRIVNRHDYSYHEADPLWETAQLIKEHFGITT